MAKGKNKDGKLIFEGEYLNGKRHGIGKKYGNDNFKLIFEGEFYKNYRLNGKTYYEGKLEFEGENFLNQKWNGKGYNKSGKVIYELHNGTGKVKEYNVDYGTLIFEG